MHLIGTELGTALEVLHRLLTATSASQPKPLHPMQVMASLVFHYQRLLRLDDPSIATKEQAEGSRQIIQSVENMNRMTQQVSFATAEQKRGGELVVQAMENISAIARDNLSTVDEMSKATANLATQAENLAKLIAVFRAK